MVDPRYRYRYRFQRTFAPIGSNGSQDTNLVMTPSASSDGGTISAAPEAGNGMVAGHAPTSQTNRRRHGESSDGGHNQTEPYGTTLTQRESSSSQRTDAPSEECDGNRSESWAVQERNNPDGAAPNGKV